MTASIFPTEEDLLAVLASSPHFLTKTLPRMKTVMSLHVLAYNLTRVMNILAAYGNVSG